MKSNLHLDSLDRRILGILTKNARIPFLKIAKHCKVSGAAIHQRFQKLIESKVIRGSQFNLDYKGLGYHTCAFIGVQVNLTSASTHEEVFAKIQKISEIVECYHITGKFSLLLKIYAKSNEHLKDIIVNKVQSIIEITNTETFISLEEGFIRQIPVED